MSWGKRVAAAGQRDGAYVGVWVEISGVAIGFLKVEFGVARKERLVRPLGAWVCVIGQTSWGGVEESKCTTVEGEVTAGSRSLCAVHAAGGRGLDRHLVAFAEDGGGGGVDRALGRGGREAIRQTSSGVLADRFWCADIWEWEVAGGWMAGEWGCRGGGVGRELWDALEAIGQTSWTDVGRGAAAGNWTGFFRGRAGVRFGRDK